jgi:hypothetical protein
MFVLLMIWISSIYGDGQSGNTAVAENNFIMIPINNSD